MAQVDLYAGPSMTMSPFLHNLANYYNIKSISTLEVIDFSHLQSISRITALDGNILAEAFHKHLTLQEL